MHSFVVLKQNVILVGQQHAQTTTTKTYIRYSVRSSQVKSKPASNEAAASTPQDTTPTDDAAQGDFSFTFNSAVATESDSSYYGNDAVTAGGVVEAEETAPTTYINSTAEQENAELSEEEYVLPIPRNVVIRIYMPSC